MKKRIIACLLILALALSLAPIASASAPTESWTDAVTSQPAGYATDASGSVTISSAEGLAWLISVVNGLNGQTADNLYRKTVTLTGDIDLSGRLWTPIGTEAKRFKGSFDGGGHTISGLYVSFSADYAGLFGWCEGTIKDITLTDAYVFNSGSSSYTGGVCGFLAYDGRIVGCAVSGTVSGYSRVGGVCGCVFAANNPAVSVSDCVNRASVSGIIHVGGVCGQIYDGKKDVAGLENCLNTGDVSGDYVGGVVGFARNVFIDRCGNSGSVTSRNTVGGVAGWLGSSDFARVENCWNEGDLSADTASPVNAGGVCGWAWTENLPERKNASLSIANSYNTGSISVSVTNPSRSVNIGGVCGYLLASAPDGSAAAASLENCYSVGDLSASNVNETASLGGVAGLVSEKQVGTGAASCTVSNCYWLVEAAQEMNGVPRAAYEKLGVGAGDTAGLIKEFSFTSEQAVGLSDVPISGGGDDYASAPSLFDALDGYALKNSLDPWRQDEALAEGLPAVRCNWLAARSREFSDDGDADDKTIPIAAAADLALLAYKVKSGEDFSEYTFTLTNDISITEYDWTPIGTDATPFAGTFLGGGHTISGLYLRGVGDLGLFARLTGKLSGVKLENAYVEGLEASLAVGALCGSMEGSAAITDCSASGAVTSAGASAGGLVGALKGGETTAAAITSCENSCRVSGAGSVGGVLGQLGSTSEMTIAVISNVGNSGKVDGLDSVGGVCGKYNGSSLGLLATVYFTNCYNTGEVSADEGSAGGVLGSCAAAPGSFGDTGPLHLANSYSVGALTGASVGGVIGKIKKATPTDEDTTVVTVEYCYWLAADGLLSGVSVGAYPVTEAQARGTEAAAPIAAEGYANNFTLAAALNAWVADGDNLLAADCKRWAQDRTGRMLFCPVFRVEAVLELELTDDSLSVRFNNDFSEQSDEGTVYIIAQYDGNGKQLRANAFAPGVESKACALAKTAVLARAFLLSADTRSAACPLAELTTRN